MYTASVKEPIITTHIKSQRDWGLTFYDSHILPLQCKQLVMSAHFVFYFLPKQYIHAREMKYAIYDTCMYTCTQACVYTLVCGISPSTFQRCVYMSHDTLTHCFSSSCFQFTLLPISGARGHREDRGGRGNEFLLQGHLGSLKLADRNSLAVWILTSFLH